jgi:hypothetical protein
MDDGVYANILSSGGNGIYGEADFGSQAYGVLGTSASGFGVVGSGEGGTGIGVWGVSTVSTTGTGVLAEGADTASPALSIAKGGFQVQGAGIGTETTAFTQLSVATNTDGDSTYITNPLCDGNPNAILIITHLYNPPNGNVTETLYNKTVGVWYDGTGWAIYNEDQSDMGLNIAFNVLVIIP